MDHGAAIVIEKRPTPVSRTAIAKAVSYLRTVGYKTVRLRPGESWRAGGQKREPDFVLLGSGDAASLVAEVKRIHATLPKTYVLVAVDTLNTKAASEVYSAGAALVAPARAFVHAVRNIISGMLRREDEVSKPSGPPRGPIRIVRHPIEEAFVENFHDPRSGRLDARRVAEAYGVSISALAQALKITQSALSKRRTAMAAQAGLRELEFVWGSLRDVLGTDERVRAWLNSKRPDLGDQAPIELLIGGSAEALANYIRSVVAGEPG